MVANNAGDRKRRRSQEPRSPCPSTSIETSFSSPIPREKIELKAFTVASIFDDTRLSDAKLCPKDIIEQVWEQKERLSAVHDAGQGRVYSKARLTIFPEGKRPAGLCSRAGEKIIDIAMGLGALDDVLSNGGVVLDVCGGPGAWSQAVLSMCDKKNVDCKVFGVSLRADKCEEAGAQQCAWHADLLKHGKFTPIWGKDGTGDVYQSANVLNVAEAVGGHTCDVVMCDGGFQTSDANHKENCQELIFSRLVLSEFCVALNTLKRGGVFVCKLVDTFSWFSASLLFIIRRCFKEVEICKPTSSRLVNSERYVV